MAMNMEDLKKAVDEALKLSPDELKGTLSTLVDGIKGFGVGKLIEAVPDMLPKLMRKLDEMDVGKFVSEAPEASAKFMEVLWEGVGTLAEKNPELKQKMERAGEIKLNYEATDSPVKGHLKISAGKLSGGPSLLEAPDLKIFGSTKTMVGLLTGAVDPVRGFMAGQYKMEGSMAIGMKLVPVVTGLTKMFKGG